MSTNIFIDGAAGTTGLEIRERLAGRRELSFLQLGEAERKDPRARARALNEADIVILCLPDEAAREAVALIENPNVRVIDASTGAPHSTGLGLWICRIGIRSARQDRRRQACEQSRMLSDGLSRVGAATDARRGLSLPDFPLTVNAVSGYSGGGKAMIAEFEDKASSAYVETVMRTYAS